MPYWTKAEEIGRITSGSYSPTLDTSIGMGYVLVRYAAPGNASSTWTLEDAYCQRK